MRSKVIGEWASAAAAAALLFCGSVQAQVLKGSVPGKAPCMVNALRMRIATGGDDLRGGDNNLNVTVRFGTNGFHGAPNVNKSAAWDNNTVHMVEIRFRQPVPLNEINGITLDHLANGGLTVSPQTILQPGGLITGLKTADNWDMQSLEVTAVGEGAAAVILRHGPKRFTGDDPILNTRVQIPANSCGASATGSGSPSGQPGLAGPSGGNPPAGRGRPGTPSRKLTPQQINALLAKTHGTAGKASPVVTNPAASRGDMTTIGILQQQKQTALTERNQGSTSGSSTPTPSPARTAVMTRVPGIRGPISTAAAPPPPSSIPNRGAAMAQPNLNVACGTFRTAMITGVSGQQGSGAVFTQDPQFNPFTIRGCNFGSGKGQAQLNFADGKKLTGLTIDTWTDSMITVELPAGLTGVLDQPNVTLVLFPANGAQAQRSGFRFYAKRTEMHLASIPASEVTLAPVTDTGGSPVTAKFSSPYATRIGGDTGHDTTGPATGIVSGGVDRVASFRFPGGTDVFDFSKLKPGFVIEKYQVKELSLGGIFLSGCNQIMVGNDTDYTDGDWGWQLTGNTIQVSWKEDHDHNDQCDNDGSNASYGLDVWLIGPPLSPGESPWQDGVQ